jgi:hypothetical protein
VKIKNETRRFFPVKMKPVDTDPWFYIKEIFFERDIVFELEIGFKFLRFEDEFFLEEICQDREQGDATNDIPDETGQLDLICGECNIIDYLLPGALRFEQGAYVALDICHGFTEKNQTIRGIFSFIHPLIR